MPYKNPTKRRAVKRQSEAKRRQRNAALRALDPVDLEAVQLGSVTDVRALLEEQIAKVRGCNASVTERARCITYMLQLGLRMIEANDLEQRIAALEAELIGKCGAA